MVLCLLYKDFSCIKRKNSKIDHLLGNQTKIFRSHETSHLYGHCDASIKPSLAPSAEERGKGCQSTCGIFGFSSLHSTKPN